MASNGTEIVTSPSAPPSPAQPLPPSTPPARPSGVPSPSISAPGTSLVSPQPAPPPSPSSIVLITSVTTESPASTGGTGSPSIVIVTSTSSINLQPTGPLAQPSSVLGSSSTSAAGPLPTSNAERSGQSGGLPQGGKIAVAVVVPIAAIALLVVGLLFFWKKRKERKIAEEQRKEEMEVYSFNPNNNPTLPPVSAVYGENKSEDAEDAVGYRGWGTTNSATMRNPSTNLSSGQAGIGVAVSDDGSHNGGNGYQRSPSTGAERTLDGHSNDPLFSSTDARPTTGDSDLAALGAAPVAGGSRQERGVHRGASNASSAYSTGPARSEGSDDISAAAGAPVGSYYHEDVPYPHDGHAQPGLYGENSFPGAQPVIRDVQARRNTRIEKPSVYPQQGSSGIAQNF